MASREYNRLYRERNKEALRLKNIAWREANKDAIAARRKAQRNANPEAAERAREYVRQWRKRNPEKSKGANRRWNEKNRDRWFALLRQRFWAIRRATPKWADRGAIVALYEEAKRLTRETGIEYHVDHVIPLRGKLVCGLHVESNLRVVQRDVNQSKANKFDPDFAG